MQGSVNTCNSVHLKTQLIDGYVIVQTKNRQIQVKSTFHLGLFVGPVHNVGANHRLLKSTHTHTYKSTHIFYVIHTLKLWLWPTEKAAILSYFHMQTQHRHTHSNHNTWSNNRQWQHSPREFIHITRTTSTDEGFSFYPNKWQKPRKKDQYTEKQRSHLSSSQYRQTTAQKLTTVYIYMLPRQPGSVKAKSDGDDTTTNAEQSSRRRWCHSVRSEPFPSSGDVLQLSSSALPPGAMSQAHYNLPE